MLYNTGYGENIEMVMISSGIRRM